jgi:hypothetical protein
MTKDELLNEINKNQVVRIVIEGWILKQIMI